MFQNEGFMSNGRITIVIVIVAALAVLGLVAYAISGSATAEASEAESIVVVDPADIKFLSGELVSAEQSSVELSDLKFLRGPAQISQPAGIDPADIKFLSVPVQVAQVAAIDPADLKFFQPVGEVAPSSSATVFALPVTEATDPELVRWLEEQDAFEMANLSTSTRQITDLATLDMVLYMEQLQALAEMEIGLGDIDPSLYEGLYTSQHFTRYH